MDKKTKIIFSIIFTAILFQSIINPVIEGHQLYVFSDENNKDNWEQINHNVRGTNYSPQNQINSDNAHMLELKWTFPIPPAPEFNEQGVSVTEGSMTPPLIINGTVYFTSNMRDTYAIDSVTGNLKWVNVWDFDWQEAYRRLPITGGALHVHGLNLIDGKLFPSTVACSILAINPEDGEVDFELNDTCRDIEGNEYNWDSYTGPGLCGLSSHPGIEYENIYVTQICGADSNWGGRAFIDGYDLNANPPERLWRTFLSPPSEGDPEWALRECDKGWFFSYPEWKESGRMGIPCNEVPRENLINDWGVPKHYNSAVGLLWGQMALDQENGIVYFGTGNQGGWVNNTYAIGPNLFASSIVAMNVTNGEMIWWYQTVPRDMVQADAAWNTVLTELNINGEKRKAIIKYSVTGLLWALDAATGEPLWIYESHLLESRVGEDGIPRGRTSGHPCIGCDPRTQDGYWNDVMSHYDMKEKKWLNYPSKDWFYIIPLRAGEADIAYNEKENIIILPLSLGWDASAKAGNHKGIGVPPGEYNLNYPKQKQNTTILGLDADTGEEIWSYFIDGVAYRGGIIATEDLAIIPAADGNLYILNGLTGELLHKIFLNTPLTTQPTIGRNSDGEFQIYVINGGRGRQEVGGLVHNQIPGSVIALGLSEKIGNIVEEEVEEEVEEMESEIISSTFLGIIIIIMVTIPVILLLRRR
uniref:Alcohol dehydrogenase (Acceptor) n=1 Tax=uncultured marine thaumarchaeote KM3_90_H07 TaxID=1456345 RepID=A0A075I3S7_9ARCH|nr:alcohol dehydrogenase (acceptor) [uncultured marine thaumarchaeote KM3_90_H07]